MSITRDTINYLDEFYGEVDVQLALLGVDQSNCYDILIDNIIESSLKEDWKTCCTFEAIIENLKGTPTKIKLYLELLNIQGHGLHQEILRFIQDCKFEQAIPHIDRMLSNGLRDFKHRTSDSDTIASWVSHALHALADIRTKEAIALIKKYTLSDDPFIRKAMLYRLQRLN